MSFVQLYNSRPVDQNEIMAIARAYVANLRTIIAPQKIFLFGSLATGQFKLGSDIDLLLVFKTVEEIRSARLAMRGFTRLASGIPVDYVFMTEPDFAIKSTVGGVAFIAAREGVPL